MNKKTQTNQKDKTPTAKNKPKRRGFKLILFIILLLAILGAGKVAWQKMQSQSQAQGLQPLKQQLQDNSAQIQALQQQLAALTTKNSSQADVLQQAQAALQKMHSAKGGDDSAWVIAETEYLVRLAVYNLQFEQQVNIAIALLETANQRLASLADPSLLNVRQLISNNIATLQALPQHNMENILLQLSSLQQQVLTLPLFITKPVTVQDQSVVSSSDTDKPAWRQNLDNTWHELKQVVVIRHNSQDIQPILSDNEKSILQQNIHTLLGQAQWATLYGNQALYQQSLQQAEAMVKRYFDSNAPSTKSFLTNLQQLLTKPVRAAVPNVAATLSALQAVQKNNNTADNSTTDNVNQIEANTGTVIADKARQAKVTTGTVSAENVNQAEAKTDTANTSVTEATDEAKAEDSTAPSVDTIKSVPESQSSSASNSSEAQ